MQQAQRLHCMSELKNFQRKIGSQKINEIVLQNLRSYLANVQLCLDKIYNIIKVYHLSSLVSLLVFKKKRSF